MPIGGMPDPGQVVAKPPHLQAFEIDEMELRSEAPAPEDRQLYIRPDKGRPELIGVGEGANAARCHDACFLSRFS
jgi:hypothetical protein